MSVFSINAFPGAGEGKKKKAALLLLVENLKFSDSR